MIGSMQTYLCADIIASNKETVTDALVGILRRPSTAEGVLGAQVRDVGWMRFMSSGEVVALLSS